MAKRFYIIDGHAHIYRAYYAPFRDLTSSTGEPTKATFVFTQMLMNLIENRKPDYLAMVIDSRGDVFRNEFYPEYKANRTSPPDDFYPQEKRILQIVKDAGIPIFAMTRFEADDIIATMVKKLQADGFEVFIVSKDKDLRQMLSDTVFMFDPQSNEVIDIPKMIEKVGYGPHQAIEIQTLMGDKIDNVPGIPGVGEKTALDLIKQFGTAAEVVRRASEIKKPKLRENVEQYGDKINLSRQLVTLKDDVPIDWTIEQCAFTGLNTEGLRPHLAELGFKALLSRIEPQSLIAEVPKMQSPRERDEGGIGGLFDAFDDTPAPTPRNTSAGLDYVCVNTDEILKQFISELKKQTIFAFDTETDSLTPCDADLVGMSFSWKSGTGYYVPVRGPIGATLLDRQHLFDAIQPILENPAIHKIGHHLKYDIQVMRRMGVLVRGLKLDTMLSAFLLDSGRMQYGIDRLALDLLNFKKIPTSDLIGSGKSQMTMDRIDLPTITRYAAEDTDVCWRLYELFSPKLAENMQLLKLSDEIETPLIDVLADMEYAGIAIDPAVLKEQSNVLGERILDLRDRIFREAGTEFNIDSPKQLGEILFVKLQLETQKKTKTGFSTDIEVLEKLASVHPVPKLVLEYRSLVKLKGTYLDTLTDYRAKFDGRIHTSFNQTGAATGRLSSSDPNMQNIPIRSDEGKRIRMAFVPGDPVRQVLLSADYSQIELRVLAHLSEEPALMRAFADGQDVHATVASEVFGVKIDQVSREQRSQAKVVNFGIIYGITAMGLSRRIDGLSIGAAKDLIVAYNKRFPRINTFMQECVEHARVHGFVQTIVGRRRPVFDSNSAVVSQRNAAERVAINSVVQGSAADLIKIAMVNIHRKIQSENHPSRMLLQVHDELVFESPIDKVKSEAEFIKHEMINAMTLKVPLEVEVGWGKNWGEGK